MKKVSLPVQILIALALGIAVGAVMILCFEGLLRLTRRLVRKYAKADQK